MRHACVRWRAPWLRGAPASRPVSTRPRRPCPLYFALQSLISKRQWYEIPIRALNVYFPRTSVLDRYRAGIVEAGFDDRFASFERVTSGIHPHGAASGLREACFLNVTLLSVFSVRSALDRPQIPRRRLNFDSHANQQYCLAISRALAAMDSARLAGAMTLTLGPQLKIHD